MRKPELELDLEPDDPRILRFLIAYLFNGWEQAVHSRDSAFQVLQSFPDWKKSYEDALANPDRIQYTAGKFAGAQTLIEAMLQGTVTRSQVVAILQSLGRKPS
jgi:hypothetical protein